jgi:hypothetical protein
MVRNVDPGLQGSYGLMDIFPTNDGGSVLTWTGWSNSMIHPLYIQRVSKTGFLGEPELLSFSLLKGWNLTSVPVTQLDYERAAVFPSAISQAYSYSGEGYITGNTLEKGKGYFVKFPAIEQRELLGVYRRELVIPIHPGWNLIGSISSMVPVSSIVSNPGGIVTSQFFGYDGSYYVSQTIDPGKAYWVKVSEAGTLKLSASTSGSSSSRIKIDPSNELPPPPPIEIGEQLTSSDFKFSLDQNYPNPFNPVTTIRYEVPSSSFVTLKILNVMGQVVSMLIKEEKPAGSYHVIWDASDFPSGVYFYRLQTGSYLETRKLVLMK